MTKIANNHTLSTTEWNTASKAGLTVSTIGIIAGVVIAHFAIGGQSGVVLAGVSGTGFVAFAIAAYATHNKKAASPRQKIKQINSTGELCDYLKNQNITEENVSQVLQSIDPSFFANKSHERAKEVFSSVMEALFRADVDYPNVENDLKYVTLTESIGTDPEVFQLSTTQGVQFDIPNSANDASRVHIYQVASQYNAAEAPRRFTPAVGEAMATSAHDNTQGPLAQRTNPVIFEIVTAFLANLGFNMLEEAAPSAGKTYVPNAAIAHGYLRPTAKNIAAITDELGTYPGRAEYVCYPSDVRGNVYIFLQAAPDVSTCQNLNTEELEKNAAYANYLALFGYGIERARELEKPVVLHAAAVGGGAFKNKTTSLLYGLQKAMMEMQTQMKANEVFVQLEAFNGEGPMKDIAKALNIQAKPRIGDPQSTK